MDIKHKLLKVIDFVVFVMFFIGGSILSKILIMDGGQQNIIWIFIPMGIYRMARIRFNILVASIMAALGSMLCVFGFLAAISKW